MWTGYPSKRNEMRGAMRPVTLIALCVLGVLVLATYVWVILPQQRILSQDRGEHAGTAQSASALAHSGPSPSVDVEAMGVSISC